jgi:hypothetical protein
VVFTSSLKFDFFNFLHMKFLGLNNRGKISLVSFAISLAFATNAIGQAGGPPPPPPPGPNTPPGPPAGNPQSQQNPQNPGSPQQNMLRQQQQMQQQQMQQQQMQGQQGTQPQLGGMNQNSGPSQGTFLGPNVGPTPQSQGLGLSGPGQNAGGIFSSQGFANFNSPANSVQPLNPTVLQPIQFKSASPFSNPGAVTSSANSPKENSAFNFLSPSAFK